MSRNFPYKIMIIMMMLLNNGALASDFEEKVRTYEKDYQVDASTLLRVANRFGKVHINTWNQKRIQVKVEVRVVGQDEKRTDYLMSKIEVAIIRSVGEISCETDITDTHTRSGESFQVNYVINMPESNPLEISNKFGDIYTTIHQGEVEIDLEYGNLKGGDFLGPFEMELSFGKATVNSLKHAEVEIKYSGLDVVQAGYLNLESQFSNVNIETVERLDLECKYGEIELGTAGEIDADCQFSKFSIAELQKKLVMEANYVSNFSIDLLSSGFDKVVLQGKFTTFNITTEQDLRANIEGEFSFSDIRTSRAIDFYYKVKEAHKSEYKGRIGGGHSDKKIFVESSYGDLRLK